jgi:hypothetical protein
MLFKETAHRKQSPKWRKFAQSDHAGHGSTRKKTKTLSQLLSIGMSSCRQEWTRVARFFLVHDTKTGKMYQMNRKCTKMVIKYLKSTQNIPNGHEIYKHCFNLRPSKIYPNWDFGFKNKPSGNPGVDSINCLLCFRSVIVRLVLATKANS